MVLRIDRTTEGEFVVMTLSGHLALDDVEGLRQIVAAEPASSLIVDLRDVVQVDRDAVAVLSQFRAAGIALRHCPAHVVGLLERPPEECP